MAAVPKASRYRMESTTVLAAGAKEEGMAVLLICC
jgi:hypothetical protein